MPSKRALNSDEFGESLFYAACTRKGLVANKAIRDRTGWDYRVEIPNAALDSSDHADKRSIPPALMFQIKTMRSDKAQFAAPLLSMERFAKGLEPSFILVILIDNDDSIAESYLIHIAEASLDAVLKRLVKEGKSNKLSNNKRIAFKKDKCWTALEKDMMNFFEAATEAYENYAAGQLYSVAKQRQFKTAGYDENSFIYDVTFQVDSENDLEDGMLGLRSLRVVGFSGKERRFGITRAAEPLMSGSAGIMTIDHPNALDCKLVFRDGSSGKSVGRKCKVIPSPLGLIAGGRPRFLVRSDPIVLDCSNSNTFRLSVDEVANQYHEIRWWRELYDTFEALTSESLSFDIYTSD